MRVTFKQGRAGKIHVSVDGEYKMTVDGGFWFSLGIANGSEIDEDGLEVLSSQIAERRAFNKGVELLSRREHSRFEIVRKLNERGFADCSQAAATRLEESGYLDDERFAFEFASQLSEKRGMGKKRIALELHRRGVERDIVDAALDALDDEDEEQRIAELLEGKFSRYPDDERGRLRCFNALVRLGYSQGAIRRVMRSLDDNGTIFCESFSDMV